MGVKKFSLTPPTKKHSRKPKFMSDGHTEYKIVTNEAGFYKIVMYGGGWTPRPLRGVYTSPRLAENALVSWLKRTNTTGEAIYPGCPALRRTSYTEPLFEDSLLKPPL